MNEVNGKVSTAPSASKGLQATIATHSAAGDVAAASNYASGGGRADRVVAGIRVAIGKAADVEGAVSKAAFGTPNILLNNASMVKYAPLQELT